MARGQPDDYDTIQVAPLYTTTDLADVAARLGAAVSLDRRGRVLWYDDFESGLNKWDIGGVGAGSSVALSSVTALRGSNCVRMGGGPNPGDYAYMYHYLTSPFVASLGLQLSFSFVNQPQQFDINGIYYTGTRRYSFGVRWRSALQVIEYYDASGAWLAVVGSYNPIADDRFFHYWKLALDFANQRYWYFVEDGQEWNMSLVPLHTAASATARHIVIWFNAVSRVGYTDYVYVDDVVLTEESV